MRYGGQQSLIVAHFLFCVQFTFLPNWVGLTGGISTFLSDWVAEPGFVCTFLSD